MLLAQCYFFFFIWFVVVFVFCFLAFDFIFLHVFSYFFFPPSALNCPVLAHIAFFFVIVVVALHFLVRSYFSSLSFIAPQEFLLLFDGDRFFFLSHSLRFLFVYLFFFISFCLLCCSIFCCCFKQICRCAFEALCHTQQNNKKKKYIKKNWKVKTTTEVNGKR